MKGPACTRIPAFSECVQYELGPLYPFRKRLKMRARF